MTGPPGGDARTPSGLAIDLELLKYLGRLPDELLVDALADLDYSDEHAWCGDELAALEASVARVAAGLHERFVERRPLAEIEPPRTVGEFDYEPRPLGRTGVMQFLHAFRALVAAARERGDCVYAVGD